MLKEDKRPIFLDLKTDFGFKHCMGNEQAMLSFLNAILSEDYGRIAKLTFENVENDKRRPDHRGVTYDLHCTLENGDHIIVEMQNYGHEFFKTRANYYLYKVLDKVIPQGVVWSKMEEDIPRLIGIFILGVPMMGLNEVLTKTAECDLSTHKVFWDRMYKYYISLPKFHFGSAKETTKKPTLKDVWLETLKNLGNMKQIDPHIYELADDALLALIEKAKVSALTDEEYAQYEAELKILSDEGAAEAYGYKKGKIEGFNMGKQEGFSMGKQEGFNMGKQEGFNMGKQEGFNMGRKEEKINTARLMLDHHKTIEDIVLFTGLTKEEILALSK